MKKFLFAAFSVLVLIGSSGCATIVSDDSHPVNLRTTCGGKEIKGANCTLSNSKGTHTVKTPGVVTVRKSFGDTINCEKGDATGQLVAKSSCNGPVWGNVLAGGLIGAAVDMKTGAGYEYKKDIVVPMEGKCSKNSR